jgi:hypothetical protein
MGRSSGKTGHRKREESWGDLHAEKGAQRGHSGVGLVADRGHIKRG